MQKVQAKKPYLLRLIADNRRYWVGMGLLVAMMLVSGLIKSYAADFLGRMVDAVTLGQYSPVAGWGTMAIGAYLLDALCLSAFNVVTVRVVDRMFLEIKVRMFDTISRCRLVDMEQNIRTGDVISRASRDISTLSMMFAETYSWLISVFVRGVVALIFCCLLNWKLALVYVILLPLTLQAMKYISKPIQEQKSEAAKSGGKAISILSEALNHNEIVKAFGAEDELGTRFSEAVDDYVNKLNQSEKRGITLTLVSHLVDVLQFALLFILGALFVTYKEMTIGEFVAFVALTFSLREAFGLADQLVGSVREGNVLAQRVSEMLDLPAEQGGAILAVLGEDSLCLDIRGLDFGYVDDERLLSDINVRLERGQRIAFVGPSGSGKTTLLKLICKLYEEYEGEISLFGLPLKSLNADSVRSRIAVVLQDPCLFHGTIAENIRYGRPSATDAEVEQVLRDVQLWEYVQSLPKKINAQIGDFGSRLSGGQKQRLAIARALIRGAELVLLDEATSALDAQTEAEIQRMLSVLFKDKTVIVIAHNAAALNGVDYVYCLDQGKMVEEGPPEVLARRSGYFSCNIATRQEEVMA